jgi:hypothetical protein
VDVLHEHPVRLSQFVKRRHMYASSIGMLARRHPDALPAVWLTPRAALVWLLALCGFRASSAGVAILTIARTDRRLRTLTASSPRLAAALALRGLGHTGVGLSHAIRRAWSPLLLTIAHRCPRVRSVLAAAFAARLLEDALTTGNLRAGVGDMPLRVVDELIATVGTWEGCVRARTLRPLLPSFRLPRGASA